MSLRFRNAAVCALLCACIASGHDLQSNEAASYNRHYDAMLGASNNLDDSKMADSTSSSQSVFDIDSLIMSASRASPAEPTRPPVGRPKKDGKAAVKVAANQSAKIARQMVKRGNAVEKAMAKQSAQFAKQVAQDARITQPMRATSARNYSLKALENKELKPAGLVMQPSQRAALPTNGKVGHINVSFVAPVKPAQVKENKTKATQEAVESMPMESVALHATEVAGNSTEHAGATKAASNSTEHSLEAKPGFGLIPAFWRANATHSLRSSRVSPTKLPTVARPCSNRTHAAEPAKRRLEGKVGHINALSVARATNSTQVTENKTKAIEEAVVSLPMASFALEDPKPAKNRTDRPVPGNATQKSASGKKDKVLEKAVEIPKTRLDNVSESMGSRKHPALPTATGTFSSHVGDAEKKETALEKAVDTPQTRLDNVSESMKSRKHPALPTAIGTFSSHVGDAEKKEKALEKAVEIPKTRLDNVSESMKSRKHPALPTASGTFSSHVGDAEKKEMAFEKAVDIPQTHLDSVSESMESRKQPALPAAIGTLSSHVGDKAARRSEKFLAVQEAEQLKPIWDKEKPKAKWSSTASVAEVAADPPHREVVPVQPGFGKKATMVSTFTATPIEKVQSIISLSASVDHAAAIPHNAPPEQVSLFIHLVRWLSSMFAWMTGKQSGPVASQKPIVSQVAVAKLSDDTSRKQDSERTAQATLVEHQHIFDVTDAWSQMEQEDIAQEERVQHDDVAERQRAEVVNAIPHLTKSELQRLHGPHTSGFWSNLEKQDGAIEESSQSDDLVQYAQLAQAQDSAVAQESEELDEDIVPHAGRASQSGDARLAIHEPWLRRELRDKAVEQKIRDSPDLQMLQLGYRHQRK